MSVAVVVCVVVGGDSYGNGGCGRNLQIILFVLLLFFLFFFVFMFAFFYLSSHADAWIYIQMIVLSSLNDFQWFSVVYRTRKICDARIKDIVVIVVRNNSLQFLLTI